MISGFCGTFSYPIKEDAYKLQHASKHNEDVKDRMKPSCFCANTVKYSADCIGYATGKQPQKSRYSQYL